MEVLRVCTLYLVVVDRYSLLLIYIDISRMMKVVIRVLIFHVTLTLPPPHSYQSVGDQPYRLLVLSVVVNADLTNCIIIEHHVNN